MKRLGLLLPLLLTSCPDTGVVCQAGTDRCGNGCADFKNDSRNCGGCGQACLSSQVCAGGSCQCRAGTQLCDGQCVVIENDPKHCGACRNKCPNASDVCDNKTCRGDCTAGTVRCGFSCVNVMADALHCGACDKPCPDSQSCRAGQCQWDMVAACFSTGQVAGLQSGSEVRGPLKSLGRGPISLQPYGSTLLAADSLADALVQARLPSLEGLSEFNQTGKAVNQVVVDLPLVYAVNSTSHTLQVLQPVGDAGCPPVMTPDAGCGTLLQADGGTVVPVRADGGCFSPQPHDGGCASVALADGGEGALLFEDGGCFVAPPPLPVFVPCFQGQSDAGLKLATIGQLDTGANTFPQAVLKSSGALWIPLQGGEGGLLKVDISNPARPTVAGSLSFSGFDLHAFDGGMPLAGPYAIAELGGSLYVALNNLGPDYQPAGPGLLAQVNPATMDAGIVDLGTSCLNPVALTVASNRLLVSCAGAAVYTPTYQLLSTRGAGVLAFHPASGARAMWSPQCPSTPDAGCLPILPSRLAVRDGRVYLGDQNGGRIFVAELLSDGGFQERRGYGSTALSGPIQMCAVDPGVGFSNVADILVLP